MSSRPRITRVDPAFMEAVAAGLKSYRDGKNPEKSMLTDSALARRLGVSKSTLSKYLRGKQLIGGEPLRRMFTELGIAIAYKNKEISARDFNHDRAPREELREQISFVFDAPCRLDETAENVSLTIQRKAPQQSLVMVHIRVAG